MHSRELGLERVACPVLAIVGVVDDDLVACGKVLADLVVELGMDLGAELLGVGLAAADGKVVGREVVGPSEALAAVVAEREDPGLDAEPEEIAFEGVAQMGLAARGEADGGDQDLAGVEELAGGRRWAPASG